MKIVLALLLISTAAFASEAPPKFDPAKQVTVTLAVQDWQAVVTSVGNSDRVSAHDANRINQTIAAQVNQQLAPPPPTKK